MPGGDSGGNAAAGRQMTRPQRLRDLGLELVRGIAVAVGHYDLSAWEHLHASTAGQLQTRVLSDEVHHGQNQIAGFGFANQWQQVVCGIDGHSAGGECPRGGTDSLQVLVSWTAFGSHKNSPFHNVAAVIRPYSPKKSIIRNHIAVKNYQSNNYLSTKFNAKKKI
jgi:hypothetical protein